MFYLESKLRNLDTQSVFFCKSAQGSKWEKKNTGLLKFWRGKRATHFIWNHNPFFNVNHISKNQWDDFFIDCLGSLYLQRIVS